MKKVIIILIIFSLVFISFFVFKKDEEKENKNISVILETEEGNIETNKFPSKNDYEYLSTECENTSDNINTIFNESTWKLNLSVEEEKIDGEFNCTVHFREKEYKVEVDVENGSTDKIFQNIVKNNDAKFNLTPNTGYSMSTVSCTNNQNASITNNVLTVSNVTSDTVCTVIFSKYKYIFDFTNNEDFNKLKRISGSGTFGNDCDGILGLCYKSYNEAGSGTWNETVYSYDFNINHEFKNYKFTIDYIVENKSGTLSYFVVNLGNFAYYFQDAWALDTAYASLYTSHNYQYGQSNTWEIEWLKNNSRVDNFDGSLTLTKKDSQVSLSGPFNINKTITVNNLKFNDLKIMFANSIGDPLTKMYIRKIIIEEL